ncbi:MAG: ribosome small subunit-dependent GTPase A [Sphaerochaetaceae bacterium]
MESAKLSIRRIDMEGTVTRGINNIYTVSSPDGTFLCRIKGKILETKEPEYNPLAVGDHVQFNRTSDAEGLITLRLPRRNCFQRWNPKGLANQTMAANVDLVLAVCSVESPPFRPRFIDRVIACSRGIEVAIVVNKSDILYTEDELERIELYRKLGYQAFSVSAKTGENIDVLKARIQGLTVALVGQSGVGKSTLVNSLIPSQSQKTGELCEKYNRGRHTTTHSTMIEGEGFVLIDTPGVREFSVWHDDPHLISDAFVEFAAPSEKCEYHLCLHDNEPGCEVKHEVEEGLIDPDRYESYIRMLHSLDDKTPKWRRALEKDKEDVKKDY